MLLAADFCLPTLLIGLLDLSRVTFARWTCAGPLGAKSRIVSWLSVFGIELLKRVVYWIVCRLQAGGADTLFWKRKRSHWHGVLAAMAHQ